MTTDHDDGALVGVQIDPTERRPYQKLYGSGMVATLTLTEFLLARIAEDEERWRDAQINHTTYQPDEHPLWVKLLAECEVKRGLIELHPEAVAPLLRLGAEWAYDEVLRRLATVYADHPDYRREWRP